MTSLSDFLVNNVSIYPTSFGTIWLNKILPTVVGISFVTSSPFSFKVKRHFTFAFNDAFPSA